MELFATPMIGYSAASRGMGFRIRLRQEWTLKATKRGSRSAHRQFGPRLSERGVCRQAGASARESVLVMPPVRVIPAPVISAGIGGGRCAPTPNMSMTSLRSEEHTSELQSLMRISYAVFCLKKKNKTQ